MSISLIINTLNEEVNIKRSIDSAKSICSEIIVCDMHSDDKTVEIAKKLGAKVIYFEKKGYVEPARNYAISKATQDWILILDADEELSSSLADRLKRITEKEDCDFVEIPRKNIIFGKWMQASMWWPDYNIRFFKKNKVEWLDKIHSQPKTYGKGLKLEENEQLAIIHHHYNSLSQYLERLFRYTQIQAEELRKEGISFRWVYLLEKPLSEFLSRFFANSGFKDGVHGLSLSLLQAFSELVVYLRLWEMEKFKEQEIRLSEVKEISKKQGREINYWFKYGNLSANPIKRFLQKGKNKFLS